MPTTFKPLLSLAAAAALAACATAPEGSAPASFDEDREAILAMAGDYKVTFDFTETVAFGEGYELKEPKLSGGYEVVRVIEDTGEFISLQHILVVGGDAKFPIKHWRQDWTYEPADVLVFTGANGWETRDVSAATARGAWSQEVYQVDDAPRYGAVGRWSHANGVSEWTPPAEIRPLPRRDMTTRDDYDAVLAVNRHAITPAGWVHEQDNSKLVLRDGAPHILAREIGVNTYTHFDGFDVAVADDYWAATEDYWAAIRTEWARLERENEAFAFTFQGEPEPLYTPLLSYAASVEAGDMSVEDAVEKAKAVMAELITTEPAPLADRLATLDE